MRSTRRLARSPRPCRSCIHARATATGWLLLRKHGRIVSGHIEPLDTSAGERSGKPRPYFSHPPRLGCAYPSLAAAVIRHAINTVGDVTVTRHLVAVGRELIAVGRALVLVRAGLITVNASGPSPPGTDPDRSASDRLRVLAAGITSAPFLPTLPVDLTRADAKQRSCTGPAARPTPALLADRACAADVFGWRVPTAGPAHPSTVLPAQEHM
jgi:hypothetical protein